MDARWYDPNIGRFLSQDTWSGTLVVPWTQNKYAYVGNNPINMWDPTGNVPEWVRDKQDYVVDEYEDVYYYDYDKDDNGELDDWNYTRVYKEWYEYISYSYVDSHTATLVDVENFTDRKIEYYQSTYEEAWKYNYHVEIVYYESFFGEMDFSTSNEIWFYSEGLYTWEETIYAWEMSLGNEESKKAYGSPPPHAKLIASKSRVDGETFEAVLDVNKYESLSFRSQRLLTDAIHGFFDGHTDLEKSQDLLAHQMTAPRKLSDGTAIKVNNRENSTTKQYFQDYVYDEHRATPLDTQYVGWLQDTYGRTGMESFWKGAETVV